MLPTLVIFFRESLEASLILGILLAYLHRAGRPDARRAVWSGAALAVVVDLALALATWHLLGAYAGSRFQTVLEGATYVVAAGLLTWMSLWMKDQSRALRRELEAAVRAALSRGSVAAVALLAAVTVGREGLETVFFTLAVALRAQRWALASGAALGVLAGLAVSYWIYRLGRRVPLALLFNTLGVVLLLFAAGLLADGIQNFQTLGWLPFLHHVVWHSGALLSENSAVGDLLHSFLGYAQDPSILQVGAYAAFLAAGSTAYLRIGRRRT